MRLWNEAGMLPVFFEGDKRPRGVLYQPGDRLAQKRFGRAAGQEGDAGKLRREIGGNLHARSNLSSIGGRAHTTLWSIGLQMSITCPILGGPSLRGISWTSLKGVQNEDVREADSNLARGGYLGYLIDLK